MMRTFLVARLCGTNQGVPRCQRRSLKFILLILVTWISVLSLGYVYEIVSPETKIISLIAASSRKYIVSYRVNNTQELLQNSTLTVVRESFRREPLPSNRSATVQPRTQNGSASIQNVTDSQKNRSQSIQECTFPSIDPFDPAIKKWVKKYPTINCSRFTPNLVYLSGDFLKVRLSNSTRWLKKLQLFKHCRYSARVRNETHGNDRVTSTVYTSPYFNDVIQLNETDDYVFVECYDKFNHVISRSYIHRIRKKTSIEAELRANYEKHVGLHAPRETLSVMMVGLDGMSKQNMQRTMPKTRDFLLGPLKAVELHKYNKIGLNTFPNVVGLLMGKHEIELNFSYSLPFDLLNDDFIWSEYRRAGYRTALTFDMSWITAFHYLKRGWSKSPVDYYFREMVIDSEPDKLMRNNNQLCLGEEPEIDVLNGYSIQLASIFNNSKTEPYFAYSFAARLTHDDQNMASAGDDLYYKFLKTLADRKVLNNTVLVFFSDHGERFGAIRSTYNGMIEGRTPYMFLVFPEWFHAKYPHLMKVMKVNQERLTSHFDVHATLRDLLYFRAESGVGDIAQRGISLFKEIPRLRTCQHIGVSEENCVCNHFSEAKVDPNLAQYLALTIVNKVIDYTNQHRKHCSVLTLGSVETVMVVNTANNATQRYQLTVTTEPGAALYEAVVAIDKLKKADVIGDVTRLNMYKGQAECIKNSFLRQFCYCQTGS